MAYPTGVFMLRQLPPWLENLSKRQVKSPKVFVRDSGLLHVLLGIGSRGSTDALPQPLPRLHVAVPYYMVTAREIVVATQRWHLRIQDRVGRPRVISGAAVKRLWASVVEGRCTRRYTRLLAGSTMGPLGNEGISGASIMLPDLWNVWPSDAAELARLAPIREQLFESRTQAFEKLMPLIEGAARRTAGRPATRDQVPLANEVAVAICLDNELFRENKGRSSNWCRVALLLSSD